MQTPPQNRAVSAPYGRTVHAGEPAAAVIERMANTMRTKAEETGAATKADLLNEGFTPNQINRHGDAAAAQAGQGGGAGRS